MAVEMAIQLNTGLTNGQSLNTSWIAVEAPTATGRNICRPAEAPGQAPMKPAGPGARYALAASAAVGTPVGPASPPASDVLLQSRKTCDLHGGSSTLFGKDFHFSQQLT